MPPPREIELKLDVPIGNLPRLIASPLLKRASASARKPANLVSVYFDTDKLKLRQRGLSLRLRWMGRSQVRQTIKQEDNGNAALFTRGEWEHDICTNEPDLDAARETGLAPLLNKKLRRSLKPVFETRVQRKVFEIHSGNSDIELSIDKGTVEAGRKSTALCEVEVELKQGQPSDLFMLAKLLAREIPVQLAVKSKADRGYALLTAEKTAAVKAAPITLAPDADVQSAFQIIARACLQQLVANQSLMLAGDAEALHQMRVALRRLRAAISLFSGMLTDSQTNGLKAEFKWIAGELGPARELEIFLKRVVKPAADREHDEPGIALVSEELRHKREQALARARAAVDSQRFRDLALDTAAWIETGDWTRNADQAARMPQERSVTAIARAELRRRWKKILKVGKRLDELDEERRHKLRIQTKKLRYATEFFATIFPGNKSRRRRKRFVARLEQLQDALGDLNDIAVNGKLSEQLVASDHAASKRRGGTKKAFAVGRLSGREEALIAPVLKQAEEAYAALTKSKPFWE